MIVRPLGEGSMGQVYLAEDAVLARLVAIKFIAAIDPDLAARQRFLMEARAAARIQHPNVVSIYRVGELQDRPYIVSELVRGTSLAAVARPMTAQATLAIAIDLARGLAAAHRRGVVHCDIKPDNVIVTEDNVAKLVDFGLAQVVQEGGDADGTPVGTPDYMAPEVWGGKAPSRRSDVYSLGAVMYELLAGQAPFAGIDARELGRIVGERDAPSIAMRTSSSNLQLDIKMSALVDRCLARDPDKRFASGEELREALEQIQQARNQPARSDENPYRGLRTFEASHRGLFFGRGLEIGELVERMRTESVVVVAGDSGVGKSSLCRAGVVPAIAEGGLNDGRTWQALTLVPGRRPLQAMAAALDDPSLAQRVLEDPDVLARELHKRNGVVLFVDQLEELVTVGDPAEVAAFDIALARISEGVPGVRLITTVRADFLSRIATLPRFGNELSRVLYFVRPLPPERIRDVITGPAAATSVTFESEAMIGELVDATAQAGSGGLPLLSFALAELWEARDRDRGVIAQGALDAMGGVAGALARHGDSVIAQMPAADRVYARKVLLRLVTSLGTRVRRTESELSVGTGTRAALDALVKGRLLVVHDGEAGATFELAHEVMVRGWGTLRDWLDADAEAQVRRERLAEAAAEWQRIGHRNDATWRGSQLAEALGLEQADLTVLEREFVAASERAVRRRTWLRRGIGVAVVVLVILVYIVQRHLAANDLAGAVADELSTAGGELDAARAADHQRHVYADAAFAAFDTGKTNAAEDAWKLALSNREETERGYRAAARAVEAALAKDPTRADVRALLGDILLERAEFAELVHDKAGRDELLSRIASYDADGTRRARWKRAGKLVVHAPSDSTLDVDGHRFTGSIDLAAGAYVVTTTTPGHVSSREPIVIRRDLTTELTVRPPTKIPDGFVYVADGWFQFGSDGDEGARSFLGTVPIHWRRTGGFAIAKTEVTFGDWIDYVEAQPPGDRKKLLPHIVPQIGGGVSLETTSAGWRLSIEQMGRHYVATGAEPIHYAGRSHRIDENWRRMPVLGITALDSLAYAKWLDQTGRVPGARMCSEVEWERAARGPDGREYPAGHALDPDDANIDITYDRTFMGPDEVGSHPASTSPYGLLDTVGNAFEWTSGDLGVFVMRGGSYYHDRKTGTLTNRNEFPATLRDPTEGLRLCASTM